MVPSLPAGLPATFTALHVNVWRDLAAQEFEPLRLFLGRKSQRHIHLCRTFGGDDEQFTVLGVTGIHDYHGNPAFEKDAAADPALTGFDLHYGFRLRRGAGPKEETEAGWDEVVAAIGQALGTHSADAVLYERHQTSGVVPAVALPITVKEADVPGFSEIRGVRLVKMAPEGEPEELYSVTIDRVEDDYLTTVVTSIELALDERILVAAYERARSIADLALHRVTK